jgi:hypothetical protein
MSRSDQRNRQGWDGADAPGGASQGHSPARGAPDAVPRSGAALIKVGRHVRISEPALAAFIKAGRVPPLEISVTWRQNRQVS